MYFMFIQGWEPYPVFKGGDPVCKGGNLTLYSCKGGNLTMYPVFLQGWEPYPIFKVGTLIDVVVKLGDHACESSIAYKSDM